MKIICHNDTCAHYRRGDRCSKNIVQISEGGECDESYNYMALTEYQKYYWKAIQFETKDGRKVIGRLGAYGKKIEIFGREFYTDSPPTSDEDHTRITDARTGYFVGTVSSIKRDWSIAMTRFANIPDVLKYPIIVSVYDRNAGRSIYDFANPESEERNT